MVHIYFPIEFFSSFFIENLESSNRQSSTSNNSKVSHITKVTQVDNPLLYERTTDASPSHQASNTRVMVNNIQYAGGLIDNELSGSNHSKKHVDSGIEFDQNSSSSTIYNQRTDEDRLLFPQTNRAFEETALPTLSRRVQKQ